ncbi:MAG: MBL fold metallo-hydrolase [Bacteroidetes bacterium]|nr:MBL fold metallo-hydrolase [Bacteroidota bacterium]
MIRYSILGSGSSANAYIFESDSGSILVDNGFSAKELIKRAVEAGHDLDKLHVILLTHTHSDHMRGVGTAARKLSVPVSMHKQLSPYNMVKNGRPEIIQVKPWETYSVGDFTYTPFPTSHDVPYSISYSICVREDSGSKKFVILTDTGEITSEVKSFLTGTEVLFLEANYDLQMLLNGPYPLFLKRRIFSKHGHLSNDDAVELLRDLQDEGDPYLKKIFLCHLSDNNNNPGLVTKACEDLISTGMDITVCRKGGMYSTVLE